MINNKLLPLFLIILLSGTGTAIAAGDPSKGRIKAQACESCHGKSGISRSPNVPNLAGQHASYIEAMMKIMKEHERKDELMNTVANMITNPQDIADIAAFYAMMPAEPGRPSNNPKMVRDGETIYKGLQSCNMCHGDSGEGNNTEAIATPKLSGQKKDYLIKAMKDFRDGNRMAGEQGYMMNVIMPLVSEEGITAIAEYLSTQ